MTETEFDREALALHSRGRPGKIEILPTKPLTTQRDLSLAYSPGVAAPCRRIAADPNAAYDYTAKGNLVAVITNGTAVLGLGALGGLAAKPVMEGKAVLFKRFADVDAVDLELDTFDPEAFIAAVRHLGPSFGGINLEDIKAPECFVIERSLRELMDIPVFHDDQHGTAIIVAAGFINALDLTGRTLERMRLVVVGAGAAATACVNLLKAMGLPAENVVMCDEHGVIYRGREIAMDEWKARNAADTKLRSLKDALVGADAVLGVSVAGAIAKDMVAAMADRPIVFALANPDPEISPDDVRAVRPDAIIATGRSDYPNQVNNVLGFPYVFRGALDVRASAINDAMKIAAAQALAALAREDVPDEVDAAYAGRRLRYGPDYIIPTPFDPRLIATVPVAVARAAGESGVARRPLDDVEAYHEALAARLDPTQSSLQRIHAQLRTAKKRVVFAEGEEERVIRAALQFRNEGDGTPVLIGREDLVAQAIERLGLSGAAALEVHNARLSTANKRYTDYLYGRLQRRGALYRDCQRMVNQDRNVFAACMVACEDADAMVTGLTRSYNVCFEEVRRVIDPRHGERLFGLSICISRGGTVFLADTAVHERPTAEELVGIALQSAEKARQMGHEPRVAFLSYATYGDPPGALAEQVRDAVALLAEREPDFEFDGEMAADVALDPDLMAVYPFTRLSGPANVLIMPGLHAASISAKLLEQLGGGSIIGPLTMGLARPVQIVGMAATVSELVTHAALAAYEALRV